MYHNLLFEILQPKINPEFDMQAIILCGGRGERLRPITKNIPKPMVIINKKPFLEHQIMFLSNNGFKNFVFCVGYLWNSIFDYFGDGSRFGVNIAYSIEKKLLGTGGALKIAAKFLEQDFFIVYGDSFLPINYQVIYEKAKKINKIGVIIVYNNKEDTNVRSNIVLNQEGLVRKYSKINLDENMRYVDAGVSIFKKKVLNFIPSGKKVSLENGIFKKLININELSSIKTNQRFYDIGTPERLKQIGKVLQ